MLVAPQKHALFSPPLDHYDSDIDQPPPPKNFKPVLSMSHTPHAYHPLTGLLYIPLATPVAPALPLPVSPAKVKQPIITPLLPIVDDMAASTCSKSRTPVKNKKANVCANTTHQTATHHATDKAAAIKKLGNQPAPLG